MLIVRVTQKHLYVQCMCREIESLFEFIEVEPAAKFCHVVVALEVILTVNENIKIQKYK